MPKVFRMGPPYTKRPSGPRTVVLTNVMVPATGFGVLMLGDTPYDIEAAARAGIKPVALRCGGWDEGSLSQAITLYDDPEDMLVHFATSPFYSPAAVC